MASHRGRVIGLEPQLLLPSRSEYVDPPPIQPMPEKAKILDHLGNLDHVRTDSRL